MHHLYPSQRDFIIFFSRVLYLVEHTKSMLVLHSLSDIKNGDKNSFKLNDNKECTAFNYIKIINIYHVQGITSQEQKTQSKHASNIKSIIKCWYATAKT